MSDLLWASSEEGNNIGFRLKGLVENKGMHCNVLVTIRTSSPQNLWCDLGLREGGFVIINDGDMGRTR